MELALLLLMQSYPLPPKKPTILSFVTNVRGNINNAIELMELEKGL
jgi:hypothetical protein